VILEGQPQLLVVVEATDINYSVYWVGDTLGASWLKRGTDGLKSLRKATGLGPAVP
jgi:hypothetical protein